MVLSIWIQPCYAGKPVSVLPRVISVDKFNHGATGLVIVLRITFKNKTQPIDWLSYSRWSRRNCRTYSNCRCAS
jgi:hypothetical protein